MKKRTYLGISLATSAALGGSVFASSQILGFSLIPTLLLTFAAAQTYFLVVAFEGGSISSVSNLDGRPARGATATVVRVAKWVLALVLVAFGMASLSLGLNTGNRSDIPYVLGVSLSCFLLFVALLTTHRWALWAALLSALGGIAGSAFLR